MRSQLRSVCLARGQNLPRSGPDQISFQDKNSRVGKESAVFISEFYHFLRAFFSFSVQNLTQYFYRENEASIIYAKSVFGETCKLGTAARNEKCLYY